MSPAARRKRLRKTSSGSGSANQSTSIDRLEDHQQQNQQQSHSQQIDGSTTKIHHLHQLEHSITSFSVTQSGALGQTQITNTRQLKGNSSPVDVNMQQEHLDDSTHLSEMVSSFRANTIDQDFHSRFSWGVRREFRKDFLYIGGLF